MKVELYNLLTRRNVLKGGAAMAAVGAASMLGLMPKPARQTYEKFAALHAVTGQNTVMF